MTGEKNGFGGLGQGFGFVCFASGLEAEEFGHFALAAAGKAMFLQVEVAQLFFVAVADVDFMQGGMAGIVTFGIFPANGRLTDGDDGLFDGGNAGETPAEIGDGLNEGFFFRADGLKLFFVAKDVIAVTRFIFAGEEDGDAGESGFDSVEADGFLPDDGTRTGGGLGVLTVGRETGGGDGEFGAAGDGRGEFG